MERHRNGVDSHVGTLGWCALAAGVAAFDILAPESLSAAAWRAQERPLGRLAVAGGISIVGMHLLRAFDSLGIAGADPINRIADVARIIHGTIAKHGE